MTSVAIIDRVTLAGDEAMPWLDRMRAEYAPAAEGRGMRLTGTWWTHVDADAIEVCLLWELPDVAAFWSMKRAAHSDPSIERWWAATDAIALERHRRVYAST
jgi:hypothetical protein